MLDDTRRRTVATAATSGFPTSGHKVPVLRQLCQRRLAACETLGGGTGAKQERLATSWYMWSVLVLPWSVLFAETFCHTSRVMPCSCSCLPNEWPDDQMNDVRML